MSIDEKIKVPELLAATQVVMEFLLYVVPTLDKGELAEVMNLMIDLIEKEKIKEQYAFHLRNN